MGEYATRKSDLQNIKIGTCEDMYYLRLEDCHKVRHESGNVDPMNDIGLRFRLPFADEDDVQPGEYKDPFRGIPLYQSTDYGTEYWKPDLELNEGLIQLHHKCGLLINVPCYHGQKLPEFGDKVRAFWNGKGYFFELAQVKRTTKGIVPIIQCKHCGNKYMADWCEVYAFIPCEKMRERLSVYMSQFESLAA